jgi:hypothetical protein
LLENIEESKFYKLGNKLGLSAGNSITDGNTTTEEYKWIMAGYEDGDSQVMDLCPNPLSGEWAGESIPEIFGLAIGEEYPSDEDLTEFEQGFSQGFIDGLIARCQYMLGN